MKLFLKSLLLTFIMTSFLVPRSFVKAQTDNCDPKKDIMLNISVPFIGRCIKKDPAAKEAGDNPGNSTIGNVFPKLMGGLIRLTMTAIYIIGFLGILLGGFMVAGNGALGTKQ